MMWDPPPPPKQAEGGQTRGKNKKKTHAPLHDAGRGDRGHLGQGVRGREVLELLNEREDMLAHLMFVFVCVCVCVCVCLCVCQSVLRLGLGLVECVGVC